MCLVRRDSFYKKNFFHYFNLCFYQLLGLSLGDRIYSEVSEQL